MTRTFYAMACGALLAASACGTDYKRPTETPVNCAAEDGYEFKNIFDFEGGDSGWYYYTDFTPGGVPAPAPDGGNSNVPVATLDAPRCGSPGALKIESRGNNFWGSGFGDWVHNASPADGTGFQGISFWGRSVVRGDKTFMLKVQDDQTFPTGKVVDKCTSPDVGTPPPGVLRCATAADKDLDGDGYLGPGDIASGTTCRVSPPRTMGDPACYYGGTQTPDAVTRVPEPGECGNAFHTWITLTDEWQLYFVPWSQLVQWPCPNRVSNGIHANDIRMFEITLMQGSSYEFWLDDINFYRLRADADAGR